RQDARVLALDRHARVDPGIAAAALAPVREGLDRDRVAAPGDLAQQQLALALVAVDLERLGAALGLVDEGVDLELDLVGGAAVLLDAALRAGGQVDGRDPQEALVPL